MNDVNRIRTDIVNVAKTFKAEYSETVLEEVFQVFGDQFADNSFMIRVSNKQPDKLVGCYFRYHEDDEEYLGLGWDIARKSGLLSDQGRPVDRLVPEICETFPVMADGVDFDVKHGLSKIWQSIRGVVPIQEAFKLPLPKSVTAHADFFKNYHLDALYAFGIDYHHSSVNLYFDTYHPEHHTSQYYKNLLQELQFQPPSNELLELLTNNGEIALTFNFASPRIERLCFYIPFLTREAVPQHLLTPLLNQFVEEAPALVDNPGFILGWSFGPQGGKGTYTKLDVDYHNRTVPLFVKVHSQPLPKAADFALT